MKLRRFDKCCFVLEVHSTCTLLDKIFSNVTLPPEPKSAFEY